MMDRARVESRTVGIGARAITNEENVRPQRPVIQDALSRKRIRISHTACGTRNVTDLRQLDLKLLNAPLVPVSKRNVLPHETRQTRIAVLAHTRRPLACEDVPRGRRREVDVHRERQPERPQRHRLHRRGRSVRVWRHCLGHRARLPANVRLTRLLLLLRLQAPQEITG